VEETAHTFPASAQSALTPTQVRTFNDLLAIGGERPYAPPGLVEELRETVAEGTRVPLSSWTERTMWLSKSQLFTALRCEATLVADAVASRGARALHPATAVGIVAHRAIQLAHTHPGHPAPEYVRHALGGARSEERFDEFWAGADMGTQSDLLMQITSRVTAYQTSWPMLADAWNPRFEESMQAKVGSLTLAARVDLVLGTPRGTGQQTMLIADWKSGALREDALGHYDEAMFYALVATLRHGVPPFRSTVYSLASGEWTDPDVTAASLRAAAGQVVASVTAIVELLTSAREPAVFCRQQWCTACRDAGQLETLAPAA
jgi:hypothetical protein